MWCAAQSAYTGNLGRIRTALHHTHPLRGHPLLKERALMWLFQNNDALSGAGCLPAPVLFYPGTHRL